MAVRRTSAVAVLLLLAGALCFAGNSSAIKTNFKLLHLYVYVYYVFIHTRIYTP